MEDDVLIQKLTGGDQEAIGYMIDTYGKLLWVIAGGILNNIGMVQDIEECISDVFVEIWQNPKAFVKQKGTLKNYLAVMAKSKALDRYRALSKKKIVEIDEAVRSSDDDLLEYVINKEMYASLYEAINLLTEPNREIIIRRYFFEEKPAYIAEKTNISVKEMEKRGLHDTQNAAVLLCVQEILGRYKRHRRIFRGSQ